MKKTLRILTMIIAISLIAIAMFSCGDSTDEGDETTTGTDTEIETTQESDTQSDDTQSDDTQSDDTQSDDTQSDDTQPHEHVYDNACDTKCNVCDAERTVGAHAYDNACDTTCNTCGAIRTITHAHGTTLTVGDTTHYYLCSVCGDKKDETAHVFDKTVASSEYLKAAATATIKAQYYKSCVCGKASTTEYFETDKTAGTLANIQDLSKTYDKVALANPTYETNSDGAVTIEWYQGDTKLDAKPVNAGTYKVKIIIAESATYTGISAEKEFTIAKKVLSDLTVDLTYDGTNSFEVPLGAANGILADDVADGIKVCITFANKNVGAAVTDAGLDADDGNSYTNYELDRTTCTANIVPKVINNLTYKFEYNGSEYQSVTFEDDDIPGIIEHDSLFLEVCFATPDVDAVLDTSEESGFEPGFAEENYVLGENYSFSIVPKALTGSIFFDIYYGDTKKVTGRPLYYYDYEITEEEYGVVNGDSVTLRALYESPNAGAVDLSCGLYEENNYIMGDLNVNNTVISVKTIELPEKQYIAEYTGSNKLILDLSEYAEYGETLEMYFTAMAGTPSLPVSAVGEYANNVSFSKIIYSDTTNYEIKLPENYSLKIAPKKITNLDLKITEATYNNGKITLIAKDGIVNDEVVTVTITTYNSVSVGDVIELVISESSLGSGNELIEFETTTNNYQFALDENDIVGKVTIVAACDVQFDGSCSCGNSHLTQALTVPDGEPNGNLAEVHLDQYYEGGIYKMSLEGGQYGITLSEYYINYTVYNSDGIKIKPISGKFIVSGDIYIHVEVDDTPNSSDYVKVIKYAKLLDIENEEIIVTQITNPNDLSYRDEEIADYHSAGDRFVLFYSRNEEDDVIGCSVYFYYADDDDKYLHAADSNIESMEFYDINGIQLPITYDNPDMLHDDGVTAIGGVYIVITMNGEGENLRFSAC